MKRLALLPVMVLAACGGSIATTTDPGPTSSSSGGSSSGSSSSSGGSSGFGGAGSTGNGPASNCDGIPECNEGDVKLADGAACPKGYVCKDVSACGITIVCAHPSDGCTPPTCPANTAPRKDACPMQTAQCFDVTGCGQTIHCATCVEPPPSCDPGDTQVKSQKDCQEDASCYARTSCNVTIWCTGP